MSRYLAVVAACALFCLIAMGCDDGGPPVGKVTGTVTMDGQPLANAMVTFVPVGEGSSAVGKTDASGNYQLMCLGKRGAMIGENKVSVSTVHEVAGDMSEISSDDPAYAEQAGGGASDYDNATTEEPIPSRYNTETTLTKEVTSGDNVFDLELTSE